MGIVAVEVVLAMLVPVRAILGVPMMFLSAAVLVMAERHALAGRDGSHSLERDAQGQQQNRKYAQCLSHRPPL